MEYKNIKQIHRIYFYIYIIKYIQCKTQILNPNLEILNNNTYTYDNVGNKLSKQDSVGSHSYSYDNTYQLIQAIYPPEAGKPNETFAYDQVGNRNNTTVDAANKLLQDSNASYQYDNNGNRYIKTQSDGIITYYSYDYEGRLTRVETQKPSGTTVAVYKYDPLGRRIEKNVDGTITKYLYDNEDIIAEYDGNGNLITKYIHGLGIDEPLAITKNNQTYYYHADGLGSIVALTDNVGNVVQTYSYDSFGNITNQTGSIIQPFMFTGREFDSESGLYYLRARELDSKTGTFTQKDPIGFNGGDVNLYRYVENNPVNYVDPLGLEPIYSCKRPLGGKPGEKTPPLVNHQYNCVTLSDGTKKCDSSSPSLGWWPILAIPGKPSDPNKDYYDSKACEKKADDKNNCIRDCLLKTWAKPRPRYDIGPDLVIIGGTDCQEYSDDTLKDCTKQCSK